MNSNRGKKKIGVTVDQLILELIWILDLLIKINKWICSILHRIGFGLDTVRHSAELRNYVKLEEESSVKLLSIAMRNFYVENQH